MVFFLLNTIAVLIMYITTSFVFALYGEVDRTEIQQTHWYGSAIYSRGKTLLQF